MKYELHPLGDAAVLIHLGNEIAETTHTLVRSISDYFEEHTFPGMLEFVPAFTTVTIFYDPIQVLHEVKNNASKTDSPFKLVCRELNQVLSEIETINSKEDPRTIEIPVCYGGEFGPDLETVASHNNLTTEEVISIHAKGEYLVYMIGFAPGFPYLGGMSEEIATPRKQAPRLFIPAGSVGIAGSQTGIYPIATPGGWQLIGQTPFKLFHIDDEPPTLLKAGDLIRFQPISAAQFKALKEAQHEDS